MEEAVAEGVTALTPAEDIHGGGGRSGDTAPCVVAVLRAGRGAGLSSPRGALLRQARQRGQSQSARCAPPPRTAARTCAWTRWSSCTASRAARRRLPGPGEAHWRSRCATEAARRRATAWPRCCAAGSRARRRRWSAPLRAPPQGEGCRCGGAAGAPRATPPCPTTPSPATRTASLPRTRRRPACCAPRCVARTWARPLSARLPLSTRWLRWLRRGRPRPPAPRSRPAATPGRTPRARRHPRGWRRCWRRAWSAGQDLVRRRVLGLLALHAAPLPGLATPEQLAPLAARVGRLCRSPRACGGTPASRWLPRAATENRQHRPCGARRPPRSAATRHRRHSRGIAAADSTTAATETRRRSRNADELDGCALAGRVCQARA